MILHLPRCWNDRDWDFIQRPESLVLDNWHARFSPLITKWQRAPSIIGGSQSCWWCGDCCWNCPASLSARTLSLASGGSCSMGVLSSWWLGIHRRLDSSGNFRRFLVIRWRTSQLGAWVSFENSGLVDFLSFSIFFTRALLSHKSSMGAKGICCVLHEKGHQSCYAEQSICFCAVRVQHCVIPLKVRVQKRDNGRNIVVLKYLQKVSLDKYWVIVEIEF
jgi:hypothetical protein